VASRDDLEKALGPVSSSLDRDEMYAGVQARLRKDRMLRPVRRILAVGAVLAVAAIALTRTPETPAPRQERVATRSSAPRAQDTHDWLAFSQSGAARMTTRATSSGLEIELAEGGIAVEVRPRSGRTLSIETPTATVEVVGTTVAVLVDGDATDVVVGEGRVRVRAKSGDARPLGAGESVAIGDEIGALANPGPAETLLASLPGRWHPRHVAHVGAMPPAPAPTSAVPPSTPRLASLGCDDAEAARRTADDRGAPRASRREALELLANCSTGGDRMRRLQMLVELVPDHQFAWMDLGKMKERAGDRAGAATAFRRHLRVAGHGPLADDAALALCRVSVDTEPCLERFVHDRPDSDRREEAEELLRAMQR
jgi:hypothetical protein